MPVKRMVPWQLKAGIKILFSQLPIAYNIWERIGLFKHGDMDNPSYAIQVFLKHFSRVDFFKKKERFTSLEIGPGDSLFSIVLSYLHGSEKIYLVDTAHYAAFDENQYVQLLSILENEGTRSAPIPIPKTEKQFLDLFNANYLTNGLDSLKEISEKSVDFIWSQAVFEHIKKNEFFDFLLELKRIMAPGGICSHRIDLKDHLNGDLNNLRFPEWIWESELIFNSGFYTNRLRYGDMISLFKKAGFNVKVLGIERWKSLSTQKRKFDEMFRRIPDEEILISGFDVILN